MKQYIEVCTFEKGKSQTIHTVQKGTENKVILL